LQPPDRDDRHDREREHRVPEHRREQQKLDVALSSTPTNNTRTG
jgi:hypothetical protein